MQWMIIANASRRVVLVPRSRDHLTVVVRVRVMLRGSPRSLGCGKIGASV